MMPMPNQRKSPRTLFEYIFTMMIGAFIVMYALSWTVRSNPVLSANPWIYAAVLILFDLVCLAAIMMLIKKGIFIKKSKSSMLLLAVQQIFYIGGTIIYFAANVAASSAYKYTLLILYLLVTWLILPMAFYTEMDLDNKYRTRCNAVFIAEIVIAAAIIFLTLS